ncbi:MAG: hypothetical protein J6V25_07515 [Oscillospiraceae bacterium]|nr:hypothetical protein [Oscillospiraceae bacterium]
MTIRNRKELSALAAERLQTAPQSSKIALIYAAVVIGLSVISAVVDYLLGQQIDQSGGLRNIGLRTTLAALQTMLPLIQSAVMMCMELGYMAAMLRVARGQYTSPNTLRLGFDRFWVLLRYTLIENMIVIGFGFASMYLGVMIFLLTPLSSSVVELLMPYIGQTSLLTGTAVTLPEEVYAAVANALWPAFILCGIIYLVSAVPTLFRLRMVRYVLIDKPALGAFAAIRESRLMMHRNCLNLLKLDLHLWWYYALSVLASVICYGDQILPMVGIELPMSRDVSFFLFYAIYWALQFMIFYRLRNRLAVTYALAYDSIRPQETDSGVVLGNIFQI